jgi:hypothetical protein
VFGFEDKRWQQAQHARVGAGAGEDVALEQLAWISRAGRLQTSPSRKPAPWMAVTGPTTQVPRICSDSVRTRSSRPSSRITASTVSMAAQAIGPPPKVVPSSPTLRRAAISAVVITAPAGKPPARPLAVVMMSGVTPK